MDIVTRTVAIGDVALAIDEAGPGARLAVLPDAGHSPQFEAHAAWWDALSGFLASLPATEGVA